MKKLSISLLFLLSANCFAFEKEYFGYLQSGEGLCSVAIEKQNDYLHQLHFKTNDYVVRAVNIELKKNKFTQHREIFEKENDEYLQLFFGVPLPKTYDITLRNLGKGRYQLIKTKLVFGVKTLTSKDVCITE